VRRILILSQFFVLDDGSKLWLSFNRASICTIYA